MNPPASPETHARWAAYRAALLGMRKHALRPELFSPEDIVSAAVLCTEQRVVGLDEARMLDSMRGYMLFDAFGPPKKNDRLQPYVLDFMDLCKRLVAVHKNWRSKTYDLDAGYLLGLVWEPSLRGPRLRYREQIGFPVHEDGW